MYSVLNVSLGASDTESAEFSIPDWAQSAMIYIPEPTATDMTLQLQFSITSGVASDWTPPKATDGTEYYVSSTDSYPMFVNVTSQLQGYSGLARLVSLNAPDTDITCSVYFKD